MKWTRIFIDLKCPLVGHASICIYQRLNAQRAYVFIFGGWNGSEYSDKGYLINPTTLETMVSNYKESNISNLNAVQPRSTVSSLSIFSSINILVPPQIKSENNINCELSPTK